LHHFIYSRNASNNNDDGIGRHFIPEKANQARSLASIYTSM
jgi:hypothetical protein